MRVLIQVLDRLVDAGHTVVVIEHHLDVIKRADWVIDLGPEAGDGGGRVVAQGTPEEVADVEASHTGPLPPSRCSPSRPRPRRSRDERPTGQHRTSRPLRRLSPCNSACGATPNASHASLHVAPAPSSRCPTTSRIAYRPPSRVCVR